MCALSRRRSIPDRTAVGLALRVSLLAWLIALAPGCAVNPVTGDRELILMSVEDEREIDRQGARQVEQQLGLIGRSELTEYVARLGRLMASYSPRQGVDYHFGVVEMQEPNAFALPGGHIYVSRGLLLLANSEAELANVLGHEIGHVAARHAAQQDVAQKVATLAGLLGSVAAGVAGTGDAGRTAAAAQLAAEGALASYGRNQEREADETGQDLAVAAGVDPGGMSSFLRSLSNLERLEHGYSRREGYFDTHPATQERIAEMATSAQVRRWQPILSIAPTRVDFLAKLDGLAIGVPASEGVFRDGRFLHADLGLALRFPIGWEEHNRHSSVIAVSPDRDAVAVLELQGSGEDPHAAADRWAEEEGVSFRSTRSLQIAGFPAFRARAQIEKNARDSLAEITWIAFEGKIYRLSGVSSEGRFPRYQVLFRSFARSFRRLRPHERELIDDLRLRSVAALPGESLEQLSRRSGNEWDLNRTAVMNGLHIDQPLGGDFLVKIAIREPYRAMPPLGFVPDDAPDPQPPPPFRD